MNSVILAHRNLYWRIKEFMQLSGWSDASYALMTRFPSNRETSKISLPILAFQNLSGTTFDKELGCNPLPLLVAVIDVITTSQSQLDSILGSLMNYFIDNIDYEMYDMTSTEPTVIGNYSGLVTLGKISIGNPQWNKMNVPEYVDDTRLLYQGFLTFNVKLPSLP